ncbi:MAG: PTS fructose transporter subunit IIB [Endozoicomonas sp.]|uniref:PTS fructose transporter subunit IIB n=1 Tax=Endozoicomonas sp. TaxID=1892382 RepID=UPI003D9B9C33
MNIVAVTACTTGIAHTYMAAEKLAEFAQSQGHEIKVETQGALGIENEITAEDIATADLAILAIDVEIQGIERFEPLKTIKVAIGEAIKDPEGIIAQA